MKNRFSKRASVECLQIASDPGASETFLAASSETPPGPDLSNIRDRGDEFLAAYRNLDLMPIGRSENRPINLCNCVRLRNMYSKGGRVGANRRFHAQGSAPDNGEQCP